MMSNAYANTSLQSPLHLLEESYRSNQILVLSNAAHDEGTVNHYLNLLLQKIGTDPHLRFIVLERFGNDDPFYQLVSTSPLSAALQTAVAPKIEDQLYSFCSTSGDPNSYGEWAYTFARLIPSILSINARRAARPILIRSIDGINHRDVKGISIDKDSIVSGNCENEDAIPIRVTSVNREYETFKNFENRILSELKPEDKIIVIYNYWHTIQGFEACLPIQSADGIWTTKIQPLNWLSFLFKKYPELRKKTNIVVADEKNKTNPTGIFRQTNLLSILTNKDFAYYTDSDEPSKKSGSGKFVFQNESFVRTYQGGKLFGNPALNQIVDAVIWTREAKSKFKYGTATSYLPEICK